MAHAAADSTFFADILARNWAGMTLTTDLPERMKKMSWGKKWWKMNPLGSAPFLAMMSVMSKENLKVNTLLHNWVVDRSPKRSCNLGAANMLFTNQACTNAYTTSGTKGQTLYLKLLNYTNPLDSSLTVTEPMKFAGTLVPRMILQVGLPTLTKLSNNLFVQAIHGTTGDTESASPVVVECTLMSADNRIANHSIAECTWVQRIDNAQPEAGRAAQAWNYGQDTYHNRVQTFSTGVSTSWQAEKKDVLGTWPKEDKERLKIKEMEHREDIDYALLWGEIDEFTDTKTNTLIRRMMGLNQYINTYGGPDYVRSFADDSTSKFVGQPFSKVGLNWLGRCARTYRHYVRGQGDIRLIGGEGFLQLLQEACDANSIQIVKAGDSAAGNEFRTFNTFWGGFRYDTIPRWIETDMYANTAFIVTPGSAYFMPVSGLDELLRLNIQPNDAHFTWHEYYTEGTVEFGPVEHFMRLEAAETNTYSA